MNEYIAHIRIDSNGKIIQPVTHHLEQVARLSSINSSKIGLSKAGELLGLLHDFGKYQPAFQRYLRIGGRKGSVPHASWGELFAMQYKLFETAFVIDGHHKRLPNKADLQNDCSKMEAPDMLYHTFLHKSFRKRFQNQIESSWLMLSRNYSIRIILL